MTCPYCGAPAVVAVTPTHDTVWGMPEYTHGQHKFTLVNVAYSTCSVPCHECTELGDWYTKEQSTAYEQQLNELIKAKLGIDWLAQANARRRPRRTRGENKRKEP